MNLASLAYGALNRSGLTFLARRLSSEGVTLCYHNVVAQRDVDPGPTLGLHLPLPAFERQMRWLAANYDVVPLDRLVDRVARGLSPRGMAAVTFDDGYGGVFEHAWPVLQDLHIPATVFVVATAPGRPDAFWWDHPAVLAAYTPERNEQWLTSLHGDGAAIRGSLGALAPRRPPPPPQRCPAPWSVVAAAAAAGLQVGAHSLTHRSLPTLADADLRREVTGSRETIARDAGVIPAFFAYPYGHWDARVRDAVRAAGYRAAFALGHDGAATATTGAPDLWALPRVNIPAGITPDAFQAWTAGLRPRT